MNIDFSVKPNPVILLIFLTQIGRGVCVKRKACEVLSPPENGNVTIKKYLRDTFADYECDEGYFLTGSYRRRCGSYGIYEGEEPRCIPFTCGSVRNIDQHTRNGTVQEDITVTRAWPWHALIFKNPNNINEYGYGYDDRLFKKGWLLGEGTVINKEWILTVAHLYTRPLNDSESWADRFLVILGISKYPLINPVNDSPPSEMRIYQPAEFLQHPLYDSSSLSHNIALIKVGYRLIARSGRRGSRHQINVDFDSPYGKIQLSDFILPVCLPCLNSCDQESGGGNTINKEFCNTYVQRNLKFSPTNRATAIGFGSMLRDSRRQLHPEYTDHLQQTEVHVENSAECNATVDLINKRMQNITAEKNIFTDSMLCAVEAPEELKSTCKGKIGGGSLLKKVMNSHTNQACWVQFGIVSWGFGYAHSINGHNLPTFFSNIASGMSWIISSMNKVSPPECHQVTPPANGYILPKVPSGKSKIGTEVRFHCHYPHLVVGPEMITCESNGQWSSDPEATTCGGFICPKIKVPSNGLMVKSFPYERISTGYADSYNVQFYCSSGFRLIGPNALYCRKNGQWFDSEGREMTDVTNISCTEITCLLPVESPTNGFYDILPGTNEYIRGASVNARCEPGYRRKGKDSITCKDSGKWTSAKRIKCEKITCRNVQPPRNGYIANWIRSSSIETGTVYNFSCKIGYRLNGPGSITCSSSGQWSYARKIFCEAIICPNVEAPSNGIISRFHHSPSRGFISGDFAEFTCDRGYRIHGPNSITCQLNGEWSDGSETTCEEIKCPPVKAPENGYYTISSGTIEFKINTTVTFACEQGYKRVGPESIVCRDDGQWFDSWRTICKRENFISQDVENLAKNFP